MLKTTHQTIDEYISSFPEDTQETLQKIRHTIKKAAPQANESISYMMPAFKLNGILVYFAAFKDHFSLFPGASGVSSFLKELKPYQTSKGTIQFPKDKPIPYDLITKIVKHRLKENLAKTKSAPKKA